jgi:hypothetical protein
LASDKTAVLIGLVVVGLFACGGEGGGGRDGTFSRNASATCLRAAGAEVSTAQADLDYVAETASAGGIYATVDGETVTIAFSRTENDAERLEAAYKAFAEGFEVPVDDILKREGNAVLMWDATPTDEQVSTVEGCLKG